VEEETLKYQDAFVSMSDLFISACFIQYFLVLIIFFCFMCKYIPVFTSQSIVILFLFLMGYLAQATLFIRIRKAIGDKQFNLVDTQKYDLLIRIVSVVHWNIYMLFFVIIFKVEAVFKKFSGHTLAQIRRVQLKMRAYIVLYFSFTIFFHIYCIFVDEVKYPEKNLVVYTAAGLAFSFQGLMFLRFMRLRNKIILFDDQLRYAKHAVYPSLCTQLVRKLAMLLWFVSFMGDILYDTFLRPAGTLEFFGQKLDKYIKENDEPMALVRKTL